MAMTFVAVHVLNASAIQLCDFSSVVLYLYYSVQSQYSRPPGSVSCIGANNYGMVNSIMQYFYIIVI